VNFPNLAFISSFDVPQTHRQSAKPLTGVRELASMTPQHKRITYIALAKMCMPKLAELFLQFYNLMFFTLMTTSDNNRAALSPGERVETGNRRLVPQ
jgi:hypothetical protein